MWNDIKSLIGVVAPTIGTALGGPLGGMAAKALTSALGIDAGASPKNILKAINGDPEALLAIKNADNAFELRMKELDVDVFKIDADDRASARDREKAVGGFANPILAGIIIIGFFAVVAYMITGQGLGLNSQEAALIGTLIGYVSAKADQVVSYYFGSSHGSRAKDSLLAKMKP